MSDKKKTPTPSSFDLFDNKAGLVEEILQLDTYGRTTVAKCRYTVKAKKGDTTDVAFSKFVYVAKASTTCSVEDVSSGKFDVDLGCHIVLNKTRAIALAKYGKFLVSLDKAVTKRIHILDILSKATIARTASVNDSLISINDYLSKTRGN